MRKQERRAIICLMLVLMLVLGLVFYIYKWINDGGKWVSYPANKHLYTKGYLSTGSIYDKNGVLLVRNNKTGTPTYNADSQIRRATLHAVGDNRGNIATGANKVFAGKLVGYNLLSGIYSAQNNGRKLYLTIDADVSKAANEALRGRRGTVGVYNYKTGEIVCMVSSPNYDPTNPPQVGKGDTSGIYLNKLLSAVVVPGSIFKAVTAGAAIEKVEGIDSWKYQCPYSRQFGNAKVDRVVCVYNHGQVDFFKALAVSCNCGFAELSLKIGPGNLKNYVEKAGLMKSYSIDGIPTAKGRFEFPKADVTLAWTGIGQNKDLVNPASMMVYMGAIANGGKAANPKILADIKSDGGMPAGVSSKSGTSDLIDSKTAGKLDEMMRNNVAVTYKDYNYPGLDIGAKSGTAEVGGGKRPHAWFAGYIKNPNHPYAFIVLVENGGFGGEVAGSVANKVLQRAIAK